jgi:hypothetical protein
VDHKAYLVAVGVQHEDRPVSPDVMGADIDVAHTVVSYLGNVPAICFCHIKQGVFKPGRAEGIGQIGDHFQAFWGYGLIHKRHSSSSSV